ncbi:MAG TPA: O-antigen ligase family protein [Candidatus Eremiobacteraceae bacterium]|nr:O-antigen ligase family protein [Candidatus Eremiobacteraceae bacterium]
MTQPRAVSMLSLALPYGYALLMPLLPLLIELADVLPRGVAVVGEGFATALAAIVVVICVLGIFGSIGSSGWRELIRMPVMWALGALIATAIIATIVGLSWHAGIFEIGCEIGDALGFCVMWLTLRDERVRRTFLSLFFVSGICACAFAIALTLSRHPPAAFAYEHGRAAGTFLQPNEFAGYLLFLIPIGAAQFASTPWLKRLGIGAAAIGTVAIAMSASRAAILGLLIALPILARRFGKRTLLVYCIGAVIALGLGLTVLRNVAHDPSENASRIAVWRGAARMAERFALTGVGPVAFNVAYPYYKMPDAQIDEVHAHDLPLNVLIENGVLGLGALIFCVVACVSAARKGAKNIAPPDDERGLLFAALTTSFVASAVQNSVDLVTTFVFLMWWPMMGLMLGMTREP